MGYGLRNKLLMVVAIVIQYGTKGICRYLEIFQQHATNCKTVMSIVLKGLLENIRKWNKKVKFVNVFYHGKFPLNCNSILNTMVRYLPIPTLLY